MNARFLRPFARAAFRAPTAVRPSVMARPALVASQNKKTEVGPQQMVSGRGPKVKVDES
jgi:F-type H+-transporting ATPase subunit 8